MITEGLAVVKSWCEAGVTCKTIAAIVGEFFTLWYRSKISNASWYLLHTALRVTNNEPFAFLCCVLEREPLPPSSNLIFTVNPLAPCIPPPPPPGGGGDLLQTVRLFVDYIIEKVSKGISVAISHRMPHRLIPRESVREKQYRCPRQQNMRKACGLRKVNPNIPKTLLRVIHPSHGTGKLLPLAEDCNDPQLTLGALIL